MSIRHKVPITSDRTKEAVWQLYGVARVQQKLAEQKGMNFPGFALASKIVDAEMAEVRAEMAGEVLREAARAGHDVGRSLSVHTKFEKDKPVIEVEMPDLGDEEP